MKYEADSHCPDSNPSGVKHGKVNFHETSFEHEPTFIHNNNLIEVRESSKYAIYQQNILEMKLYCLLLMYCNVSSFTINYIRTNYLTRMRLSTALLSIKEPRTRAKNTNKAQITGVDLNSGGERERNSSAGVLIEQPRKKTRLAMNLMDPEVQEAILGPRGVESELESELRQIMEEKSSQPQKLEQAFPIGDDLGDFGDFDEEFRKELEMKAEQTMQRITKDDAPTQLDMLMEIKGVNVDDYSSVLNDVDSTSRLLQSVVDVKTIPKENIGEEEEDEEDEEEDEDDDDEDDDVVDTSTKTFTNLVETCLGEALSKAKEGELFLFCLRPAANSCLKPILFFLSEYIIALH